jgi:nicotinamidase-related amidase
VINRIAKGFANVVMTQDWHTPGHVSFASAHPGKRPFEVIALPYGDQVLWPDHCVQGTPGAQFHGRLQIPHAELVLRKGYRRDIDSYSAFYSGTGHCDCARLPGWKCVGRGECGRHAKELSSVLNWLLSGWSQLPESMPVRD